MASHAVELTFEGRTLEGLARDMRRAAGVVRRETDRTIATVGATITAEAKAKAAEHSKSIAPTIRLAVVPGAALIRAGDEATPIAALYELGNAKSKRTAETFRHPVWGNRDVWVAQPKHPFLAPALAVNRREITKQMERTWDRAL